MKLSPSNSSLSRSSMLMFRFSFLGALAFIFFFINIVFRLSLQYFFSDSLPFGFDTVSHLFYGIINDFFTLLFVLILPALFIFLPGDRFLKSIVGKSYLIFTLFVYTLIFVFTAFSEYFFWDEFACRFNFIAVDYLIYTNEVIRNIIESYPLFWLFMAGFCHSLDP